MELPKYHSQSSSCFEAVVFVVEPEQDLYLSLNNIAEKHSITAGWVTGIIGTLSEVRLAWFNTEKGRFEITEMKKGLELLSAQGSIALELGTLRAHVHMTMADREANTIGGHLLEGCIVKDVAEGTFLKFNDLSMRHLPVDRIPLPILHIMKSP